MRKKSKHKDECPLCHHKKVAWEWFCDYCGCKLGSYIHPAYDPSRKKKDACGPCSRKSAKKHPWMLSKKALARLSEEEEEEEEDM